MNPNDSILSTLTHLSNQSGTITTILNPGGTLSRSNFDTVVSKPVFCLSYTAYDCEIVRHTAGKIYIPNLLPPGKAFIVKPARLRLSMLTVKLYLLCLLSLLGPIVTFYPKEAHREMLGMAFSVTNCFTFLLPSIIHIRCFFFMVLWFLYSLTSIPTLHWTV